MSNLSFEMLAAMTKQMPKPVVGIVCRPELLSRIRRIADEGKHPLFGGIPVYVKQHQPQPYLAFYDGDELRRYLATA